ncbi:histone deacetylation protein Rxt3-domain-containing protein [Phyllosticta citrichinensis]
MDRQSQAPPRPPDRPLVHNPNHLSPTTTQQPYPPQYAPHAPPPPPAASQPPLHVPYNDVFARRDPFLPAAPPRRGSYGLPGRDGWAPNNGTAHGHEAPGSLHHAQHPQHPHQSSQQQQQQQQLHQHQQQPPPPPQQPSAAQRPHHNSAPPPPPAGLGQGQGHNGPSHVPYALDAHRRRSLGGASPPQYYGATRDPPPPPSFTTSRQMPPPSSPQQNSPLPQYAAQRGPPPPPPFSSGRDLPGLVGPPRTSSNMSISSLMGGFEQAAASRQAQQHQSPPTSTTAPSPNINSMQPPSPRRSLMGGPRLDYSYRRPGSPDQYPASSAARPPERPPFATAGSPSGAFGPPATASPEIQRPGFPPVSQSYKTPPGMPPHSGPYHHPSRSEPSGGDLNRPGASSAPPRPNSQPSHQYPSSTQPEVREPYDASGARRPAFGPVEEGRRAAIESPYHGRPAATTAGDVSRLDAGGRDRPSTVQPLSHSIFDAPDRQRSAYAEPPPANQKGLFWHPPPRPPHATPESVQHHADEHRDAFGRGQPTTGAPQPMNMNRASVGPHFAGPENPPRFPFGHDPSRRGPEQYQSPPTSDPSSLDRRRPDAPGHPVQGHNGYAPRSSSYEHHSKPQGEEMQKSRSFLGVSPEGRRTGRASPLPQAVQGAQAQPVVPGGDPSIKNEFGRMFSGLGSGLISAPSAHGSATPSRNSPFPSNRAESLAHGESGEGDPLRRTGSRGGRKNRRIKDEDGRVESDSNDGRTTPGMAQRNTKRTKYNHPGHHHHHLYSHHHHHRLEEEANMGVAGAPQSATPTSFNKLNGVPNQSGPGVAPAAHHHHHHHHHNAHAAHAAHHYHHHHHAPRVSNSIPPAPITKPTVEISSEAVLEKVKDRARHHLGSVVYEATSAMPPKHTNIDDRYGFRNIPAALPDHSGKENCTLTVRVPRYYLSERQRDVIVVSRWLWGSEVYSNDSDVVAACIHSGWIRGAWPEDVDVSMLDPRISDSNSNEAPEEADASQTLDNKPEHPAVPPAGFDAHVTVVVLPCLTEYKGSVCYGIKSQSRKKHEGCSFKIEKVEWIDDEMTRRGEERTGKAKRERLAAAQGLMALLTSGEASARQRNGGRDKQGFRVGQAQAVA